MIEFHELPNGRRIRYEHRRQAGDDAPTVVFLNGLSQTIVAWGIQVRRLDGLANTLCLDALGQGRSDIPPDVHRPRDHAEDLLHLLRALDLRDVDLVGFSFGSRIALRAAIAEPARFRRLVIAGCAHRETVLRRWIVGSWLDALDEGGPAHVFRVVTPLIVGERWLAKHEGSVDAMVNAFTRRNDPDGMRRLLADSVLPDGDLVDELTAIHHPTLVVRGEHDLVVPRDVARELAVALPSAVYAECPDVGHTIAIEDPDWFAAAVRMHLL